MERGEAGGVQGVPQGAKINKRWEQTDRKERWQG